MEKAFHDGETFPFWKSLSIMEKLFHYGEAFPLWRSPSIMEKPFPYGEALPLWRSLSILKKLKVVMIMTMIKNTSNLTYHDVRS